MSQYCLQLIGLPDEVKRANDAREKFRLYAEEQLLNQAIKQEKDDTWLEAEQKRLYVFISKSLLASSWNRYVFMQYFPIWCRFRDGEQYPVYEEDWKQKEGKQRQEEHERLCASYPYLMEVKPSEKGGREGYDSFRGSIRERGLARREERESENELLWQVYQEIDKQLGKRKVFGLELARDILLYQREKEEKSNISLEQYIGICTKFDEDDAFTELAEIFSYEGSSYAGSYMDSGYGPGHRNYVTSFSTRGTMYSFPKEVATFNELVSWCRRHHIARQKELGALLQVLEDQISS